MLKKERKLNITNLILIIGLFVVTLIFVKHFLINKQNQTINKYDRYFAKEFIFPKDTIFSVEDFLSNKIAVVSGPFMLMVDNMGLSDDSEYFLQIYFLDFPDILSNKNSVQILIDHVYDENGVDIYDRQNPIEKNPLNHFIRFDKEVSGLSAFKGYYLGIRTIRVANDKETNNSKNSIFKILKYEGQLIISLPLDDGTFYKKSYQFFVKSESI